jgi:hypothetical protein
MRLRQECIQEIIIIIIIICYYHPDIFKTQKLETYKIILLLLRKKYIR